MPQPADRPASLVTGADGFAGRWLCRLLRARGEPVVGWVRRVPLRPIGSVRYEVIDVTDAVAVAAGLSGWRPHRVFHLAAITRVADCAADPARAEAVNVGGTVNLLEALRPDIPVVLASTVHVYGRPEWLPIAESHPLRPEGVYARTKLQAEQLGQQVRPELRIARAFHHSGPGQAPDFALADWAQQLARGADPLVVGDLTLRRDYSDVRDIVAGYLRIVDHAAPGAVLNLCSGDAPTLATLLRLINGGSPPRVVVDAARLRDSDPKELRGDPSRARALGWIPTRSLQQSLADLAAGYARGQV